MLDSRIDTQGPIQDLQAQGILQNITLDAAVEVKNEELKEAVVVTGDLESHPSNRRRNRASCSRMNIARQAASNGRYTRAISGLRKCDLYAPLCTTDDS